MNTRLRSCACVFSLAALWLAGCRAGSSEFLPADLAPASACSPIAVVARRSLDQRLNIELENLANISTPGYKARVCAIEPITAADSAPARVTSDFLQGAPLLTHNPLDIMIEGAGLIPIRIEDSGATAYTRDGRLTRSADGELITLLGHHRLAAPITVPIEAASITIQSNGSIFVTRAGDPEPECIGAIDLAVFNAPESLRPLTPTVFVETPDSGQPLLGLAGEGPFGTLRAGMIECSNVDHQAVTINIHRIRAEQALWAGPTR